MKTLFIDCSPKRRLSASGFIADVTRVFTAGQKKKEKLRNGADHERILTELKDADCVVFCMPLYVDGVPSHVLPFLKETEELCRQEGMDISVYVIANNGFIEGKQNEPLMQIMENFCRRSGIRWCGGLGIGGGVMMNVMRIMATVFAALAVLNIVIAASQHQEVIPYVVYFGKQLLEILALCCGIVTYDIWLALCISRRKEFGKRYTRIMLPSFVFILCADIFFMVTSVINGGIFRGWFARKKPADEPAGK